jgi:hypothetical protein
MLDPRLLPDRVGAEGDAVRHALALDHDLADFAVEPIAHGEDRLQRIALSAACRTDIGFA